MPTAATNIGARKCALALGCLVAALSPCIAAAALGEAEASVQADGAKMRGVFKLGDHANYRAHEIRLPSGTVVREFVGSDGQVFAVAWHGPTAPNLRQMLGRYFDAFAAAARLKHPGHGRLQVQQDDLVIQSSGHMRAFTGRAYLPLAIPDGVDLGDLH
jgi:hypothetical protein